MEDDARPAAGWLDAFFAAFCARRPVDATFIGVHAHDERLPDFSESGLGDLVAEMRALLASAPAVPDIAPAADPSAHGQPQALIDALDVALARAFLELQIAEVESSHFQRGNPSLHAGEAVFGVMSVLLTDFAPIAERLESAAARMSEVPAFLDDCRAVLGPVPDAWAERAVRECEGAYVLLTGGVPLLDPRLEPVATRAAAAFANFATWLRRDALRRADCGAGEELFAACVRGGHMLEMDGDGILTLARAALEEAESELAGRLAEQGLPDIAAAHERLARRHPSEHEYLAKFGAVWDEVKGWVLAHDLVTWPDAPLRFAPRPEWVRDAAPYLYYLYYRSPSAFERPAVHEHLVVPVDHRVVLERRTELLRAHNDAVIRLNHVIHHAGFGHHVQNAHAFRSPLRVGRVAAVDGASRITMYCGGTLAEGWACYATDLVAELGGLSPLEEISELHSRARMCVRAIVDVELHRGVMTLEEAVALYESRAGMAAAAARAEAVKNSMNPGVALMYLIGSRAIHDLRRELEPGLGLKAFHDALLSWGSIPVSVIGRMMRAGHAV